MELEKKFLVKNPKQFMKHSLQIYYITQNYLLKKDGIEVRIRKIQTNNDVNYKLTIKIGEGEVRNEIEKDIKRAEYFNLLDNIKHESLEKIRFKINPYSTEYVCSNIFLDYFLQPEWQVPILEIEFLNKTTLDEFDLNELKEKNMIFKGLIENSHISNYKVWRGLNEISGRDLK